MSKQCPLGMFYLLDALAGLSTAHWQPCSISAAACGSSTTSICQWLLIAAQALLSTPAPYGMRNAGICTYATVFLEVSLSVCVHDQGVAESECRRAADVAEAAYAQAFSKEVEPEEAALDAEHLRCMSIAHQAYADIAVGMSLPACSTSNCELVIGSACARRFTC